MSAFVERTSSKFLMEVWIIRFYYIYARITQNLWCLQADMIMKNKTFVNWVWRDARARTTRILGPPCFSQWSETWSSRGGGGGSSALRYLPQRKIHDANPTIKTATETKKRLCNGCGGRGVMDATLTLIFRKWRSLLNQRSNKSRRCGLCNKAKQAHACSRYAT